MIIIMMKILLKSFSVPLWKVTSANLSLNLYNKFPQSHKR